MQFSYLSCSFLNHIERFGFSNTYGEMSSLYSAAIEEFKKKKSRRKQINPPEKHFFFHFTFQGVPDLLL